MRSTTGGTRRASPYLIVSMISYIALVGFRASAEVTENLGALGWDISNADMAEIDAILARHGAVTVPPGWLED